MAGTSHINNKNTEKVLQGIADTNKVPFATVVNAILDWYVKELSSKVINND